MKLRAHLLLLAAIAVLPIVVFSAVVSVLLVERERDNVRRAAMARPRALMTAMDAELRGSDDDVADARQIERAADGGSPRISCAVVRALVSQPSRLNVNLYDASAASSPMQNGADRVSRVRRAGGENVAIAERERVIEVSAVATALAEAAPKRCATGRKP